MVPVTQLRFSLKALLAHSMFVVEEESHYTFHNVSIRRDLCAQRTVIKIPVTAEQAWLAIWSSSKQKCQRFLAHLCVITNRYQWLVENVHNISRVTHIKQNNTLLSHFLHIWLLLTASFFICVYVFSVYYLLDILKYSFLMDILSNPHVVPNQSQND